MGGTSGKLDCNLFRLEAEFGLKASTYVFYIVIFGARVMVMGLAQFEATL